MSPDPGLTVSAAVGPTSSADAVEELVARLVDLQFWLMGRDAEHPAGNLLLRLGFVRHRPSRPGLPSRYHLQEGGARMMVWPCGLLFRGPEEDCLLLRGRRPGRVAGDRLEGLFDPAGLFGSLEGAPSPSRPVLAAVSRWFAGYEENVRQIAGLAHRVPRRLAPRPALAPAEPCSP